MPIDNIIQEEGEEEEKTHELIACPQCLGTGLVKEALCPKCGKERPAMYLALDEGSFFFDFKKFSEWEITKRRGILKFDYIINFVLLLIGLMGLVSLAFYVYTKSRGIELDIPLSFVQLSFWDITNGFLQIFLLTLLIDQYFIYRLARKQEREKYVIKKSYEDAPAPTEKHKKKTNITRAYSLDALNIIEHAYLYAKQNKYSSITPLHLLTALIQHKKSGMLLWRLGIHPGTLSGKIGRGLGTMLIKQREAGEEPVHFSRETRQVILEAYKEVYDRGGGKKVEVLDLWIPLARVESYAKDILYDLDIEDYKIRHVVVWLKLEQDLRQRQSKRHRLSQFKSKHGMNRAMTAVQTQTLNAFSTDMTLQAKYGNLPPSLGHRKEVNNIFSVIQGDVPGVILVGRPGVGKESMVEEVAQRMASEAVPEILSDKRLLSLNIAGILAGGDTAQAGERLYKVIFEAAHTGNVVIFINDIHNLTGVSVQGGSSNVSIDQVLVQGLKQSGLLVIGTTDFKNYSRYVENSSIGQMLTRINVSEPDEEDTVLMLEARAPFIEARHRVYFTYQSLAHAVQLTNKLIHTGNQPEKTLKILKETASYVSTKKGNNAMVSKKDIAEVLSEKIKMPLTDITEDESKKLIHLEDEIHKKYVDQDYAVGQVSAALRRARAEIRDETRPIANFLFVGPTGVGKTELAKCISRIYFSSETDMIRIDMSEYQEISSIQRLIGTTKEPGLLTEPVRNHPYSILLLDELEKAHPNILNLFLQIMDDGRLTSAEGETVDFTNLIIVATSNAGTQKLQQRFSEGAKVEDLQEEFIKKDLLEFFKPEFINRFDDVIIFKPLSTADIEKIAQLILKDVADRLKKKGVTLKVTKEAVHELAAVGYDPMYGARPLRRAIQDHVQNSLATFMISGSIGRRDTVVLEPGGKIDIQKAPEL